MPFAGDVYYLPFDIYYAIEWRTLRWDLANKSFMTSYKDNSGYFKSVNFDNFTDRWNITEIRRTLALCFDFRQKLSNLNAAFSTRMRHSYECYLGLLLPVDGYALVLSSETFPKSRLSPKSSQQRESCVLLNWKCLTMYYGNRFINSRVSFPFLDNQWIPNHWFKRK